MDPLRKSTIKVMMVSCLVLRHERRFVRAFFRFDAASVVVAHERLFAHATRRAHALHAFGRMFERAAGQAVQLRAAFVVDFVFGRAFLDGNGNWGGFVFAFVMLNTFAVVVAQKAFAAEAGWNALFRADGAGIGILARRSASRTARVEKFVGRAFLAFDGHGNRYHGAIVRWDAGSEVVSQETFLAKAADDALFGAHGTRSRVFAGRSARGTARMVDFVGRALDGFRHFHGNRFH
jgi:hypothetical protein